MVRTKRFGWVVLLALLAAPGAGRAQFILKKDQAPLPIDAATRQAVVEGVAKRLEEDYVFPDVAAKMAKAVQGHLADKGYDSIKTGQDLAAALTRELQEVSKDKHLRLMCSTEKLPKRPPEAGPTAEEKARQRLLTQKTNGGYRKVERLAGNVGYLELDNFQHAAAAAEPAAAAMNFLANTDALIIDLRRNGGGSPHGVALLCSYLFGEKPVHLNSLYWRKGNRTEEFWTLKELPGKRYLGKDVYVLTSGRTFSGAEEFCYNLQNLKRATIVGERTGGGAHPGGASPIGEHFLLFVPSGRAINPITKTNWEGTGVKPDVAVPADQALEKAHQLAVDKILAGTKDEVVRKLIRFDLDRGKRQEKQAPK
jgi:hypothetical protein